jgi:hypothetical protein
MSSPSIHARTAAFFRELIEFVIGIACGIVVDRLSEAIARRIVGVACRGEDAIGAARFVNQAIKLT